MEHTNRSVQASFSLGPAHSRTAAQPATQPAAPPAAPPAAQPTTQCSGEGLAKPLETRGSERASSFKFTSKKCMCQAGRPCAPPWQAGGLSLLPKDTIRVKVLCMSAQRDAGEQCESPQRNGYDDLAYASGAFRYARAGSSQRIRSRSNSDQRPMMPFPTQRPTQVPKYPRNGTMINFDW